MRWLRHRSRPSLHKPARPRLIVEVLEDRCVPALTPTSTVLVPAFYKALLNRDPDYPGANGLVAKIDQGVPPAAVAWEIQTTPSNEFRYRLVDSYYARFLRRHASAGEILGWVDQLAAGATQQQVEARILGSAEFFGLYGSDKRAWLNAIYLATLGRPNSEGAWVRDVGDTAASRKASPEGTATAMQAGTATSWAKPPGRLMPIMPVGPA